MEELKTIRKKKNIKDKMHWYTNDHFLQSRHPYYVRGSSERLAFFTETIQSYRSNCHFCKEYPLMVLDAGCGDGVVLRTLSAIDNIRVIGCDYNIIRAKRAQLNCPKTLVIGTNLLNCSLKSDLFDIIVLSQVLEHIENDVSVLLELNRLLKNDGIMILGVPNEGCFLGRLRNHYVQPWILKQTDHVHFYTQAEIMSKIENAGFKIFHIRKDGFMFPYSRIWDLLASFQCGFSIIKFLGKVFRSQCAGLYFICKKVN